MTARIDLSLYLVLDPVLCGGARGMVDTAVAAARAGATVVQLRAPQWKKRAWVECGRELVRALAPYKVPLLVDDQIDVAMVIGAQGVHVGQEDIHPEDVRRLLGPDALVGLSVGSLAELASCDPDLVDYYGAGPVYPTNTKADAGEALGIAGLMEIVSAAAKPVVAIGGIHAAQVKDVMAAGAGGVAVVSEICGAPDAYEAALALRGLADAARS